MCVWRNSPALGASTMHRRAASNYWAGGRLGYTRSLEAAAPTGLPAPLTINRRNNRRKATRSKHPHSIEHPKGHLARIAWRLSTTGTQRGRLVGGIMDSAAGVRNLTLPQLPDYGCKSKANHSCLTHYHTPANISDHDKIAARVKRPLEPSCDTVPPTTIGEQGRRASHRGCYGDHHRSRTLKAHQRYCAHAAAKCAKRKSTTDMPATHPPSNRIGKTDCEIGARAACPARKAASAWRLNRHHRHTYSGFQDGWRHGFWRSKPASVVQLQYDVPPPLIRKAPWFVAKNSIRMRILFSTRRGGRRIGTWDTG